MNKSIGDIAIIGMAGRFPGANDVGTFWQNLKNGVESVSFFTDAELAEAGVAPEMLANPRYVKARPMLTMLINSMRNSSGSVRGKRK